MSGYFHLLWPRLCSVRNGVGIPDRRALVRGSVMSLLGLSFWAGTFVLFYKALYYFHATEVIGDLLAYRLLEMTFITFFSVLLFSNVITALSTFYLSGEMTLILSSPATDRQVYLYKYIETALVSSWMVGVFGLPVFLSYGLVYGAGLTYYLLTVAVFLSFIAIPAPLGMIITMLLVKIFPAKRAKDLLFFLSLIVVVLLYFLIRFMQPEKLLDPEAMGALSNYIASLRGTSSPYMPSDWAAKALWPGITGQGESGLYYLLMLAMTAAALFVIGGWVFGFVYRTGYSRSQEGGRYRTYGLTPSGAALDRLVGPLRTPLKALVLKDIKTFFRDTTQWSQLFLLGALVVVYIYNFKVIPIDRFPFATFFLQNFIAFLNLALAGFVLAAVSVRFVFPAVSLEGEAFWILRTAPLGLKGFLWAKFWAAWLPIFVLAEALVLLSDHFLRAGVFMTALSAAAIFVMSFGITGLGVGLGAMYPKFRYENAAQISAGYGGVVYMLIASGFIGAVVTLLAWPVYVYFSTINAGLGETPLEYALSALCFAVAAAINVAACVIPMKKGLESLDALKG